MVSSSRTNQLWRFPKHEPSCFQGPQPAIVQGPPDSWHSRHVTAEWSPTSLCVLFFCSEFSGSKCHTYHIYDMYMYIMYIYIYNHIYTGWTFRLVWKIFFVLGIFLPEKVMVTQHTGQAALTKTGQNFQPTGQAALTSTHWLVNSASALCMS